MQYNNEDKDATNNPSLGADSNLVHVWNPTTFSEDVLKQMLGRKKQNKSNSNKKKICPRC